MFPTLKPTFNNLRIKSLASDVRYCGNVSRPLKIFSIVFRLSAPVKGGCNNNNLN